jgi:phage terminase large subunit
LFLGLDASAEGQIYANYDPAVHLVDRFAIPRDWPRFRVIDFGYENPFVCAWYAYDRQHNRLYRYREIYQTHLLVEDAAKLIGQQEGWEFDVRTRTYAWAKPIEERDSVAFTICDHDAEDRATLERYGIVSQPAIKWVKLGIEAVQNRLRIRDDQKPGVMFVRDSLVARDAELERLHLPLCTEDEIEGYVWEAAKDGKPSKEAPVKHLDHGMDVLRYACAFIDNVGKELIQTRHIIEYEEEYEISPI